MPININSCIDDCSRSVFGNDLLHQVFNSKVLTTLLITIIVVLLIMFIYPAKSGTSTLLLCKLALYIFLATFTIILFHDTVMDYDREEKIDNMKKEDMMINRNYDAIIGAPTIQVKPTVYKIGDETTDTQTTNPTNTTNLTTIQYAKPTLGGMQPPQPPPNLFA